MDIILSDAVVAKYLDVSKKTLRKMRKEGRGPAYTKVSERKVVYLEKDISDFLLQQNSNTIH